MESEDLGLPFEMTVSAKASEALTYLLTLYNSFALENTSLANSYLSGCICHRN